MKGIPQAVAIQAHAHQKACRLARRTTNPSEHYDVTGECRRRVWGLSAPLLRRRVHSPLISKKEEVPNSDYDGLEQDQPTHEPPFGLGLGVLHSPKQRRLRQQKARNQLSRILPAKVSLMHDLLDRFFSIALRERFQCLLGKGVLKNFFAHSEGSVPETNCSRLPDFDGG